VLFRSLEGHIGSKYGRNMASSKPSFYTPTIDQPLCCLHILPRIKAWRLIFDKMTKRM
jgi:hypothetical protein